ncbi:MAG: hypothetical protein H0X19_09770 [Rubrobacter sp.]|jgi:Skp family chaperone for outer membrane proteins|nr:hypothetical protein [Rubrobacteraceae bacterium]MBA3794406.1 hypothetical protein [Rubrobacter sp.]MDQ3302727.1 hypothetical protein [Actinomycetota bacterium]MDQ3429803.1 hypothetical protein [Actinomycetota bacterium]
MRRKLAVLLMVALIPLSGAAACGQAIEDRAREEVDKQVEKGKQRVNDEVQKGRDRVEKELTNAQEQVQDGTKKAKEKAGGGQ